MASTRQLALVSVASGAVSIAAYIFLKRMVCCKGSCEKKVKQEQSKIYEEKALLDQYMMFNFSDGKELLLFDLKDSANVNNCFLFPKRVALLARDHCPDIFFSENVNHLFKFNLIKIYNLFF